VWCSSPANGLPGQAQTKRGYFSYYFCRENENCNCQLSSQISYVEIFKIYVYLWI